jgi:hypothetical protein
MTIARQPARRRTPAPSPSDASVTDLRRFGQPSTYSLSSWELARHVRQLRREGWQSWELKARFTFGRVA